MTTLIRNGQIAEDDYIGLADDAAMPASGRVIVSLDRWLRESQAFRLAALTVGVRIPNTADPGAIYDAVGDRPLLVVEFPAFGDGRAYSQARLLRQRHGFRGEIRATGAAVVRDQIFGMHRCGINSFALRGDQDAASCLRSLAEFTEAYQPGDGIITTVRRKRSIA